jgi:hypothetical protein
MLLRFSICLSHREEIVFLVRKTETSSIVTSSFPIRTTKKGGLALTERQKKRLAYVRLRKYIAPQHEKQSSWTM